MKRIVAETMHRKSQKGRRQLSLGLLSLITVLLAPLWGGVGPLYAGTGCCEEGTNELLAEDISDYSAIPGATDLPGCLDTTDSLVDEFDGVGGWLRFRFQNSLAWESDWKRTNLSGGMDASFADAKDFAYFCGHGNSANDLGKLVLTTDKTDKTLVSSDTGFGDVDLEWVTFDSSKTLRNTGKNLDSWHKNAFTGGLHLLIGWHDSPLDGDTGGEFADDLIYWGFPDGGGQPIIDSWFASDGGCTDQTSGTTQMIISEDNILFISFTEHVHGQGFVAPDPTFDNIAFFISHDC